MIENSLGKMYIEGAPMSKSCNVALTACLWCICEISIEVSLQISSIRDDRLMSGVKGQGVPEPLCPFTLEN